MAEYHVENFGCRASRADGEIISAELRHRGLTPALSPNQADVIVANTCSVTAQADRTARAFLRRVHRENPTARILVTGCYAQRAPQEVAALPGVHAVIGNSHKALVPEIAQRAAGFVPLASLYVDDAFAHSELSMPEGGWWPDGGGQTRPNLKVQDGCGNRCGFCIIPTTRGHSRSLSMEGCLRNVQAFVDAGGTELVLSGINLGRWGRDLKPERTLEELVGAILDRTALPRLRLSSIEPMDWTPQAAGAVRWPISAVVWRATPISRCNRDPTPFCAPCTAAIVPGTMRRNCTSSATSCRTRRSVRMSWWAFLARRMPCLKKALLLSPPSPSRTCTCFLFPLVLEPGPGSWLGTIPWHPSVVAERTARLRELIAARNLSFRQSFLGRELSAVTLHAPPDAMSKALTDNFLELHLDARVPANQSVRVLVTGLAENGLTGRLAA